jgi:hypothetical protein
MFNNQSISICDATIHAGEKSTLALPLPEQYSCSPMYMPIKVINGKHDGPCLLLVSTLKGDEFNGLEIVNQLFESIEPTELHGTLILVPVLNVYGLTHYPKLSPSGNSLSGCFPGEEEGSYGQRIAYTFTQEILKKADFCVELQTGSLNHDNFPHVYCNLEDKQSLLMAKAFQAPVILEVETSVSQFRQTTESLHIPLLVYQAGEAMRLDTVAIQTGLTGVNNVLKKLDFIKDTHQKAIKPVISRDDDWLLSPSSGILHTEVTLGQQISKGEKIGRLSDPFSNENSTLITSHLDGVVVGMNRTPLIQEGVSIFKIASFIDNERAQAVLEEWGEQNLSNDNE